MNCWAELQAFHQPGHLYLLSAERSSKRDGIFFNLCMAVTVDVKIGGDVETFALTCQSRKGRLKAQSGPLSACRWLASEHRQLSGEGTLKGGPRFSAGNICGEVGIFV
jgi:hypothetical protein